MKAKRVWHQRPSTRSTRAKRTRLLMRRGPFCALCGRLILRGKVTLDHRQPIHFGGDNSDDNLALAHGPCNEAKGCAWLWRHRYCCPAARFLTSRAAKRGADSKESDHGDIRPRP